MYICDTNFILRYLLNDNKEMYIKSSALFDKAKSNEMTLVIEQTVFTEVVFVLSSFYKAPRDEICIILSDLLIYKGVDCDKELMLLSLEYYKDQRKLDIVDCVIAAKAKINSCGVITFDKALNSFMASF